MVKQEENINEEIQELGATTAKSGTMYIAGEALTSLMTLAVLIFLARYLAPASYGLYSIVIAFSTVLGIGSNFGIGTAFRKMIPEMKKDDRAKTANVIFNGYFVSLAIGFIIAIAGIFASPFIAGVIYHNSAMTLSLQIASVAEFLSVMFNLGLAALVGLDLIKQSVWSNIGYSLFNLFATVALVYLGYGVVGAIAGVAIGLLVGSVIALYYMVKYYGPTKVNLNDRLRKELLSFSMPVVASNIAMQGAMNFAVLFLGAYASTVIVGNYGAAYKLARFVELTITAITFILLPAFSRTLSKESISSKIGEIYNGSIYYTLLFLGPLVAYSVSVAQPLTRLLFSGSYTLAPTYFAYIVAGMSIGIIGTYAGSLLVGKGDTRKFMMYQVFAVVVQLVLLVLLTPTYQANGVILALFVITPIFLDIIYIRALEGEFKFKHAFKPLIGITIATIAVGAIAYYLSIQFDQRYLALVINGIVLLALYPPLLAIFGGIQEKNISFIRKAAEKFGKLKILFDYPLNYVEFFMRFQLFKINAVE